MNSQTRYVIFHRPGPKWQTGVNFRDQPGVRDHGMYYGALAEQGKIAIGGPFLSPDSGGMMITVPGFALDEVQAMAAADPAVQSALLLYEIRPWMMVIEPPTSSSGDT